MSWRPLADVSVGVIGSGRALRFAGRTLAELGAGATRVAPPGHDPPPEHDPYQGGVSERELRLASWLDARVDVIPATNLDQATTLARGRFSGCDIVLHDVPLSRIPHYHPAPGVPHVTVGLRPEEDGLACGLTAAGRAGVAMVIGAADREPLGLPFNLADYATGLVAAVAALQAVAEGVQRVDTDVVSVLAAFAGVNGLVYEPYAIPWLRERRRASRCGGPYPYGFWRAADGYVCAIGRTRRDWDRLVEALGAPAWTHDERFRNLRRNGSEHADELDALIEPWTSVRTRAELLALAQRHGLAIAPVRTPEEVLRDPDLDACNFFGSACGAPQPGAPIAAVPHAQAARKARGSTATGSIHGARVLDFGWVWSAPLVSSALADMGADVVKVEHPSRPDNSRLRGRPRPGWLERDDADSLESVPYFLNLNHGKRSLAVNLKDRDEAHLARRLLLRADIVVENLGEATFRRLGLHYDQIASENEGLIWLSMVTSRCGSPGMRGYAPTISSYSGYESAIGYPGDLTGMMTFGLCDPVAGTWGMLAVLAAWRERERTGRGRLLRLGQLEGFLALLGEQFEQSDREGSAPPIGNVHEYFSPYGTFATSDNAYVAVAALNQPQRAALAKLLGVSPDPPAALEKHLRSFIGARGAEDVQEALSGVVACERVLTYAQVRTDPELRSQGLLVSVHHPLVGEHLVYSQPWRLDGARPPVSRAAPMLGEHTADVLREWLDMDDAAIAAFVGGAPGRVGDARESRPAADGARSE